jgi:lipoate-protein ligase A
VIAVEERVGTVADLHALDPLTGDGPDEPVIWWCRPTDDAIVLGSRQSEDLVDRAACERAGLAVVHRRSGGGAVIMRHDSILWVDVVLPPGFAPDDVRGSMVWLGESWRETLAPLVDGDLTVHRGGMEHSPWSDLVCFAGIGPGEVVIGDQKLVGLSQRRTRRGVRVQGLVYGASVAHEYPSVFRGEVPPARPSGQAWVARIDHRGVVDRLARRITPV